MWRLSTSGNAVFISQEHAAEVTYNLLDSMIRLALGTILSMVFFQLCRAQLTRLHSPSTMMGSRRQPKNGKQTHWSAKAASKAFYMGSRGQGGVANRTLYIFSPEMSSHDHLSTGHGALRLVHRQLTPLDYAMIIHSVVGFKPKKFDLVHQTVFLVRAREVWSGHETSLVPAAQDFMESYTRYHSMIHCIG